MNDNRIDVSVPLRSDHGATLRTVVASLGADAGFSIDEIDDVRLALSEVFGLLVDIAADRTANDRVLASFLVVPGELTLTLRLESGALEVTVDELAANILRSVVDTVDIGPDEIRLSKRATEAVEQGR